MWSAGLFFVALLLFSLLDAHVTRCCCLFTRVNFNFRGFNTCLCLHGLMLHALVDRIHVRVSVQSDLHASAFFKFMFERR